MKSKLKNLLDKRYKISTQLYLSIGAAASLTVIASVVAWVSFAFVGGVQNRVNEGTVPFLASAFGTAQQSSALVAAAPRLAAVVNPDILDQIATEVGKDQAAFEEALAALIRQGGNKEISLRIKKLGEVLTENLTAIKRLVLQRFNLTDLRDTLQLQLTWVRKELNNVMVPAIDDQLFFAMTGFSKIDKPSVPREKHFSEEGSTSTATSPACGRTPPSRRSCSPPPSACRTPRSSSRCASVSRPRCAASDGAWPRSARFRCAPLSNRSSSR